MAEQEQYLDNYTRGFAYSFIVASIFNGILTILKESTKSIHDVLTVLFWHHWIGHAVVLLIVFVGLGLIFSRSGEQRATPNITQWVIGATIVGAGLIVMFYVMENMGIL